VIRRIAYGFLGLALINTVANLFLSDLNLYRVMKLKSAAERLERLTRMEMKRNEELRLIYRKIKSDPKFYKEKFVREYLLMFKEGEKVIPLPEELWYRR
jgi:rubrerythrin